MTRPTLPLRLTHRAGEVPTLLLGDVDITKFVAADGLRIEYVEDVGGSTPVVTMIFGLGALELDFDVDLLEHLLAEAEIKANR